MARTEITTRSGIDRPGSITLTCGDQNDGKAGCEGAGIRQRVFSSDYLMSADRIISQRSNPYGR